MNATIKFPPTPAATVTLTMNDREAQLLCQVLARMSGHKAYEMIQHDEGVKTNSLELSSVMYDMYRTLRNLEIE